MSVGGVKQRGPSAPLLVMEEEATARVGTGRLLPSRGDILMTCPGQRVTGDRNAGGLARVGAVEGPARKKTTMARGKGCSGQLGMAPLRWRRNLIQIHQ